MKYEFNMKMLLAGKVDARRTKLVSIVDFCEEKCIDFLPDPEKTIKENLEALTAFVKSNNLTGNPDEEPDIVNEDDDNIVQEQEEPVVQTKKEEQIPKYLQRRAHIIAEEMKRCDSGMPTAEAYGPNAPAYLIRRAGK